ncbi:hypothetical protein NN561_000813 [Cricetulus griseus]
MRTTAFNPCSQRISRQTPGWQKVEGEHCRVGHLARKCGPRTGRSLWSRTRACVRARFPHPAHRVEAPVRTLDCRVRQQQRIPQLLFPDKVPASFQPRVSRRPEILLPRPSGALGVGAAATGSVSAPTFRVKRPGRAGAVRLRRSCGRGAHRTYDIMAEGKTESPGPKRRGPYISSVTSQSVNVVIRGVVLFFIGVFLALVLNLLQIQRNVTLFPPDVVTSIFSSAWWVPPCCGTASAVIGLLYPCIDRHLGEPHKFKREWSSVMRCVAVFVDFHFENAIV